MGKSSLMGYFALPTLSDPDIPDLTRTALANISLFEDAGSTYDYLISGFALNNVRSIIKLAELDKQEIGFKPINLKPFSTRHDRIRFIKECFEMFKTNDYTGLAILYTIKGELELVSLQLKELGYD